MRVVAFLCSLVFIAAISITRSECAIQTQTGRVVLLQVNGSSLSQTFQAIDAMHDRWNVSLGVMSTSKNIDKRWLSSILYSGMRGLEGSSSSRYQRKIRDMALHPTPLVLQTAGIGWSVSDSYHLWGTSHSKDPARLIALSPMTLPDAQTILRNLDVKHDAAIVVFKIPGNDAVLLTAALDDTYHGLLKSSTSRCTGVVSDTDIRGSVLQQLGIKPERVAHSWHTINTEYDASKTRCRRLLMLCKVNSDMVIWVGIVASITCILLLFSCFAKSKPKQLIRRARSIAAASIGILPLASCEIGRGILAGYIRPSYSGVLMLAVCLVGGIVVSELSGYRSWMSLKYVMLLTLSYVVTTAIVGGEGVFGSVISAYLLSGIRLYGIGNEYMGILVGACLLNISTLHLKV